MVQEGSRGERTKMNAVFQHCRLPRSILSRCARGCHQLLDHGIHIILVVAFIIWRLAGKRGQNLSRWRSLVPALEK